MWSDEIARRIFDSHKAKHPIHPRVFRERAPDTPISIDYKTNDNERRLSQLGHQNAKKRNRQFYGWALVKTNLVNKNGRSLVSDPIPGNPYHALIRLNISSDQDSEMINKEWTHHLQELASFAFQFMPAFPNK